MDIHEIATTIVVVRHVHSTVQATAAAREIMNSRRDCFIALVVLRVLQCFQGKRLLSAVFTRRRISQRRYCVSRVECSGGGQVPAQSQGRNASTRLTGWSAMLASTWLNHASGSTPFSLAVASMYVLAGASRFPPTASFAVHCAFALALALQHSPR